MTLSRSEENWSVLINEVGEYFVEKGKFTVNVRICFTLLYPKNMIFNIYQEPFHPNFSLFSLSTFSLLKNEK